MFRFRFLLSPQGADGNGQGGGASEGQGGGNQTPEFDATKAFEQLLAKNNNDSVALASRLWQENYDLREKNRQLATKVPGEDAVVITKDDAKALKAYRDLGEPKDVKEELATGRASTTELTGIRKADAYKAVAEANGYEPKVFTKLATNEGLEIVETEAPGAKGGKATKGYSVKNADGSTTPLSEYADANWGEFASSLKPASTKPPAGTPARSGRGTPPSVQAEDKVIAQFHATGLYDL